MTKSLYSGSQRRSESNTDPTKKERGLNRVYPSNNAPRTRKLFLQWDLHCPLGQITYSTDFQAYGVLYGSIVDGFWWKSGRRVGEGQVEK